MLTSEDIRIFSQIYNKSTDEEKIKLLASIFELFPHADKNTDDVLRDGRFSQGCKCIHCGSARIRRNGHSKDGRQRYLCTECGRTFGIRTRSVLAGTRKDISVWKTYVKSMLNGDSLRTSAEICQISLPTAFAWRHRLLDALRTVMDTCPVGGVVEADETYLRVSYKGDHSKSSGFTMPRKARKRGGELHESGISRQLVCIPCAVDGEGRSAARAVTLGRAGEKELEVFFEAHLEDGSILCTDKEPSMDAYSRERGLRHIKLETQEVRDGYSIQHVNAYHSRLKAFLDPFRGVSTKHLDGYLAWYAALDTACMRGGRTPGGTGRELGLLLKEAFTGIVDCHAKTLSCRPAVPAGVS